MKQKPDEKGIRVLRMLAVEEMQKELCREYDAEFVKWMQFF